MLWLTCVLAAGLLFTAFVMLRHGLQDFSTFFVENAIMTMVTGGVIFGTGIWGVLKLLQ